MLSPPLEVGGFRLFIHSLGQQHLLVNFRVYVPLGCSPSNSKFPFSFLLQTNFTTEFLMTVFVGSSDL
jgi:hypothetical protein